MSTSYTWRLLDAAGSPVDHPTSSFPSQAEAEAWLGEEWRSLRDAGVAAVTLLDGDQPVYGPMSLEDK